MSKSIQSDISKASEKTQQIINEISSMNESKLYKLQGAIDPSILHNVWCSLGNFIQKNLKIGRSVLLPKFGLFTFSYPDVDLKYTTNEYQRNPQNREPVFIISKEFAQGLNLKSAVYRETGLRPLVLSSTSGKIQTIVCSFTEIANLSKTERDIAQLAIQRIKQRIEQLAKQIQENQSVALDIPCLGTLIIKNGQCAVYFSEFLCSQLQGIFKQTLEQRKNKLGNSSELTEEKLNEFNKKNYNTLDENAKQWLKQNLNIDIQKDWQQKSLYSKQPDAMSKLEEQSEYYKTYSNTLLSDSVTQKAYKGKKQIQVEDEKKELEQQTKDEQLRKEYQDFSIFLKFQKFIQSSQLNSDDSFNKLVIIAYGKLGNKNSKLDLTQFQVALNKIHYDFSNQESELLFKYIDDKKDNFIDFTEWKNHFTFSRTPIEFIQNSIEKNNFSVDDVFKRMDLSRSQTELDQNQIIKGLQRLLCGSKTESERICKQYILKDDAKTISLNNFINIIMKQNNFTNNNEDLPDEWLIQVYKKIKKQLINSSDPDVLINRFQQMDLQNKGCLDIANFKTCLLQSGLNLSLKEIDKVGRFFDKIQGTSNIDYSDFIQKVDNSLKVSSANQGLQYIAHSIIQYIKQYCGNDVQKFLNQINNNKNSITISNFIKATQNLIFHKNPSQIALHADIIDIDKDGLIDKYDLDTFIKRYTFIDSQDNSLFPISSINQKQLQIIIRDLKNQISYRNMNLWDCFKLLDENQDGFVTISEFTENLTHKLGIQLSSIAKNGLFSYLDYLKIGMFDYQRFHSVFTRINMDTTNGFQDSFEFQEQTIEALTKWLRNQNITFEEAFRIADKDFDGFLSKEDLYLFLKKNMQIDESNLHSQNIDRLYKLIDQYKKYSIDKNDFIMFLQQQFAKKLPKKSWLNNCIQQIVVYFSKQNLDIQEQFNTVSNYKNQVFFDRFQQWIENSQVLEGFNLTNKLEQQLFTYFDPHKKGFITSNDWKLVTQNYLNKNDIYIEQIKQQLSNSFPTIKQGFEYFSGKQSNLYYPSFANAMDSFFPKLKSSSKLKQHIWYLLHQKLRKQHSLSEQTEQQKFNYQNFLNENTYLTFEQFCDIFNNTNQKLLKNESKNSIYQNSLSSINLNNNNSQNSNLDKCNNISKIHILNKFKQLLLSNKQNINELFKQSDPQNTGVVNNIQLKNILLKLNLKLSSQEINEIIKCADPSNLQNCRYNIFMSNLKINNNELAIQERSSKRINQLKEALYEFLISPIDAFREFDCIKKGYMDFIDFQNFMAKIQRLTNQEQLGYSILRDMFDYIDCKQDGKIDVSEWVSSFINTDKTQNKQKTLLSERKLSFKENLSISEFKKSMKSNELRKTVGSFVNNKNQSTGQNLNQFYNKIVNNPNKWQTTSEYDRTQIIIAKNRKVLLDQFIQAENGKNLQTLPTNIVVEILDKLLKNNGICIQQNQWQVLIGFADKNNGLVDYRFLLDVYKFKFQQLDAPPLYRPKLK